MEIALKPDAKDGLLLYIGARTDGRGDFASLALINGFVDFRYFCWSLVVEQNVLPCTTTI